MGESPPAADASTRLTAGPHAGTFRGAEPVDAARPVLVPGDPEWAAQEARERDGVPVKVRPGALERVGPARGPSVAKARVRIPAAQLTVLADLRDVARACALPPPFDEAAVDLRGVKRATVLSC